MITTIRYPFINQQHNHTLQAIVVSGRAEAEHVQWFDPTVVVSITDLDAPDAEFKHSNYPLYISRFKFPDCGAINTAYMKLQGQMTPDQADTIVDHIVAHMDKATVLYVHCEAGLSRSRGVVAGLCHLLGFPDEKLYATGYPNDHCKTLVIKSLMSKGLL